MVGELADLVPSRGRRSLPLPACRPAERGRVYWDHAGSKGFKYLWQGATAYIRGDRLTTDAAMHTPRLI
jgi:hypothetical protein